MKRSAYVLAFLTFGAAIAVTAVSTSPERPEMLAQATSAAPAATTTSKSIPDEPGFRAGEAGLSPSERAGREIWYKATAGNARFHAYVFPQRVNVLIDWYRVLNTKERKDRFAAWGVINDPGCCVPGSDGCPAKSIDATYGFDWCPGDEALLSFVGRDGYRDPACDYQDAPVDAADPHHKAKDQRQSSCDLAFGTSTGGLGFRKFPNPRFDKDRWLKINGSLGSWEGYRGQLSKDPKSSDSALNRLADGSIEPPFLIGTSCGSCHIAFDPLNPPKDPANPQWENIKGAVGNQYSRISEVLTSGMSGTTLEAQMFAHARPGTSDTSAIATDQVHNPGTMNAIIHTKVRPTFAGEVVNRWRKVGACAAGDANCWCEPDRDGKCWKRGTATETAHHILKGGEDSIGALEAIQRVYFNIGSCSEQCWTNHLTDLRQLDPQGRNFGQTPFIIGQCRRDCPNFRAIEDRLPNILAFLESKETDATDLAQARETALQKASTPAKPGMKPKAAYSTTQLERDLNSQFGPNAVARGREVFAETCARCHSSIPDTAGGAFKNRDFRAMGPKGMRADWMGSDHGTLASGVGTNRCRALHSNHMTGHIWEEYGSETLRARAPDRNIKEPHDGGRGYYRNISLLSLWAHAPFMHNNAVGPELCGKPANHANDFYRSPYVDAQSKTLTADKAPACWPYDPSVDGRFKLYVASMEELLNPGKRVPKLSRFDKDVRIALGPRTWDGSDEKQVFGIALVLPAGTSVGGLASFQHKAFVNDIILAKLRPDELTARLVKQFGETEGKQVVAELSAVTSEIAKDPERLVDTVRRYPHLVEIYSSCTDGIENKGHPFGEDLPERDKKALIAFLATL
ncbi:MAG: cytochrome c [Casimicrobiaceae bacterium]